MPCVRIQDFIVILSLGVINCNIKQSLFVIRFVIFILCTQTIMKRVMVRDAFASVVINDFVSKWMHDLHYPIVDFKYFTRHLTFMHYECWRLA